MRVAKTTAVRGERKGMPFVGPATLITTDLSWDALDASAPGRYGSSTMLATYPWGGM